MNRRARLRPADRCNTARIIRKRLMSDQGLLLKQANKMHKLGSHVWVRRLGGAIAVAVILSGLIACGPTSQTTKPDESRESGGGYGGYRY